MSINIFQESLRDMRAHFYRSKKPFPMHMQKENREYWGFKDSNGYVWRGLASYEQAKYLSERM